MTCVYVTSDWHLGHNSAYKWSGNFSSQEEREGNILENYCSSVNKRDHVWFLGDIAFTLKALDEVRLLVGTKHLILGNHDTDRFSKELDISDLILTFDTVHGLKDYKHSWLSHAPIHPDELRGKINIHGHVHGESIKQWDEFVLDFVEDKRYYNACLENTDFKPVKYQEIISGNK